MMTRQKFKTWVGWSGLFAFIIGIAAGWPNLGAVGVVFLAAWFLSAWLSFFSE